VVTYDDDTPEYAAMAARLDRLHEIPTEVLTTDVVRRGLCQWRPAYYTVRDAAWILGVKPSTVSRAIRLGTLRAVRRHGRLVVPASALIGLLAEPTADAGGESR